MIRVETDRFGHETDISIERRKIHGDDGLILNDTHNYVKYHVGIKDYIILSQMLDWIPPIRFNCHYGLDDNATVIPLVRVEDNIFRRCQEIHKHVKYYTDEVIKGKTGIILQGSTAHYTYYVAPYDYIMAGQKIPGLPPIRFNEHYMISSNGSPMSIIKVPFDIFKQIEEIKLNMIMNPAYYGDYDPTYDDLASECLQEDNPGLS